MNIFGLYLSQLDINISDLQSQLEEIRQKKDEDLALLKTQIEVLQVQNKEKDDIIKVKQRYFTIRDTNPDQ